MKRFPKILLIIKTGIQTTHIQKATNIVYKEKVRSKPNESKFRISITV